MSADGCLSLSSLPTITSNDHHAASEARCSSEKRNFSSLLVDNVLRPLVMARGLTTPMPVILVGVIGGTLAYGISGLFLGPVVLSVAWALLVAWVKEDSPDESAASGAASFTPRQNN